MMTTKERKEKERKRITSFREECVKIAAEAASINKMFHVEQFKNKQNEK